jgi:hypothetical protein
LRRGWRSASAWASGSSGDNLLLGTAMTVPFQAAAPTATPACVNPTVVVVRDLNNDQRADVVMSCVGGTRAALVQIAPASGALPAGSAYTFGDVRSADVGLFDNDSIPDIVVAGGSGNVIYFLRGNGDGTFVTPAPSFSAGVTSVESISAADIDGDGKLDVVVVGQSGASLGFAVLRGNGAGSFGSAQVFGAGVARRFVLARDLNGDTLPDLIMLGSGNGMIDIALNASM